MAFLSQPLDQFLILNGLERGVPLVAGQRYKIVARMNSDAQAAGALRRLSGRIVAATHNDGKLREIRELLRPHGVDAVGAARVWA